MKTYSEGNRVLDVRYDQFVGMPDFFCQTTIRVEGSPAEKAEQLNAAGWRAMGHSDSSAPFDLCPAHTVEGGANDC